MRSIITFSALGIIAGIVVPHYYAAPVNGAQHAPTMMLARPAASAAQNGSAASRSHAVVIPRSARGHFEVDGRIDGRRMMFMVDTGASVVALTANDAAMLGIHPAAREFVALVRTANGTVRAAPVQLNTVEVGDLMVHDVAAMVLPDAALSDNLLGLSFLSRLARFEYANGRMVLEQ